MARRGAVGFALAVHWLSGRTDDKKRSWVASSRSCSASQPWPAAPIVALHRLPAASVPRAVLMLPYRTVVAIVILFALAVLGTQQRDQGLALDRSEWESPEAGRANTASDAVFRVKTPCWRSIIFSHGFPQFHPEQKPLQRGY